MQLMRAFRCIHVYMLVYIYIYVYTPKKILYLYEIRTYIYIYMCNGVPLERCCPKEKLSVRGEGRIYDRSGKKEGVSDGREGGWQGVFDGKYLFAPAVPQDQSLRRWRCSVSWTILHSGTGIMRGLIGRSSTSNRNTRDGCNLQGK